jgi:hypothetical protein
LQRRLTLRVVLFVLVVAAVPTAAYFAIRWYAYDNWYLSVQKNEIVIQQGHPGGVLWFRPKAVDRTGTTTTQLLPSDVTQIRSGVQEPSLPAAKRYIANLRNEYITVQNAKQATSTTTTTTTVPGSGPPGIPTTTVPTQPPTATAAAATPTPATAAMSAP